MLLLPIHNSNNNNPISPRSESDGMSYVSRMKHNNYAHVVMEMKKKQTYNSDSDEQQYYNNDNVGRGQLPLQQGGADEWGFSSITIMTLDLHINNNRVYSMNNDQTTNRGRSIHKLSPPPLFQQQFKLILQQLQQH